MQDLATFVDGIIAESTGQVISRQVLTEFVTKITDEKSGLDREMSKEIMKKSIEKIQPRVVTFEEQVRYRSTVSIPVIWY